MIGLILLSPIMFIVSAGAVKASDGAYNTTMETNKRQVAILYEFVINENQYLSYPYLCEHFHVTVKTIRKDIRVINDNFRENHISIHLVKNRGFILKADYHYQIEELQKQYKYRFVDSQDLESNIGLRKNQILFYLFTAGHYVRMDALARYLNLSQRSVSGLLKEVRSILSEYHIELAVQPHYGMYLKGRELDIRCCYIDTVCFYSDRNSSMGLFEDNLAMLHLEENEKERVSKLCLEYVRLTNIPLSQIALRKLIVQIMISHRRSENNCLIEFKEQETRILQKYPSEILNISWLVSHINSLYQDEKMPFSDEEFLKLSVLINLDYSVEKYLSSLPPVILKRERSYLKAIISCLRGLNIVTNKNSSAFHEGLKSILISASVRSYFNVVENNPNSYLKKAIVNSPLSASIGRVCMRCLQKISGQLFGQFIYIGLSLAVYSTIRKTKNLRKMNDIAILTPSDKESGESLKHRILDRYSNIIRKIDIMTTSDILRTDMSKYSCILYFEDAKPMGLNASIRQLRVDYYFTNADVQEFYEAVAIPSRLYERAFGALHKSDYLQNYETKNFEQIRTMLLSLTEDPKITLQIREFTLSSNLICNGTLNVILFADNDKSLFSRLIILSKGLSYNGLTYNRVFVHAIQINGSMLRLKTSEKVIRNLPSIIDTMDTVMKEPVIDFYDYYIYYQKHLLA